jgi:CheY-like chemotaxis protein
MPTVLIVDDSAVDRRLVGGLLEQDTDWTLEYAENGREALTRLRESQADVVVTDMQMPEMDGLDLVRALRVHYCDVPVILMTGHGSEALAIEALDLGAASYVPKSNLADSLRNSIEQVLGLVRADRTYEQLIDCMARNEFTFHLPNDAVLIDPLVDLVQQMVGGMRLCDPIGRVRVGMALEQALLNALYRGNLELSSEAMQQASEKLLSEGVDLVEQRRSQSPYCNRRVFIDAQVTKEAARFVVRDEGPGFDISTVPEAHDPHALERDGGRGLVLMRSFMDEISFNEVGNEVTMVKRREAAADAPPGESA